MFELYTIIVRMIYDNPTVLFELFDAIGEDQFDVDYKGFGRYFVQRYDGRVYEINATKSKINIRDLDWPTHMDFYEFLAKCNIIRPDKMLEMQRLVISNA